MVDRANDVPSWPRRPGVAGRVLLALEGVTRRAEVAQALVDRGLAVLDVSDGLDLLEVLGAQVGGGEHRWYPDLLLVDARLPLLDGVDALGLVRTFDPRVRAALVADEDDDGARREAPLLGAEVLDRALSAGELVERALRLRRPPTERTARALR